MNSYYDIIIYTASLKAYADPVIDLIDPNRVVKGNNKIILILIIFSKKLKILLEIILIY